MLVAPPIWTPPRRRIVRPSIPAHWRRGPHHRPHCPLHVMVDGDASLDANGDAILDANGDAYVMCCCATYRQARRCSDQVYVDLWWKEVFAPPYFFSKSGVNYYIDSTSTSNPTLAGTLLTGETPRTSCATTCSGCGAQPTPINWIVTASGATLCSSPWSLSGSANGTWTVPQTTSCAWRLDLASAVVTGNYNGDTSHQITANFLLFQKDSFGPNQLNTGLYGVDGFSNIYRIWQSTISTTTCNTTMTGTDASTCPTSLLGAGSLAPGVSVTLVPSLVP